MTCATSQRTRAPIDRLRNKTLLASVFNYARSCYEIALTCFYYKQTSFSHKWCKKISRWRTWVSVLFSFNWTIENKFQWNLNLYRTNPTKTIMTALLCCAWDACLIWLLLSEKRFPQTEHSYSFSPVCVLRCLVRLKLCENVFSQNEHAFGFSPV